MASAAYTWAQKNLPGGTDAFYSNINNFLASGKSPEEIAQAMQTYGISTEDVLVAKSLASPAAPTFVDTTGPSAPAPTPTPAPAPAPAPAPTPTPAPAPAPAPAPEPEPAVETISMTPAAPAAAPTPAAPATTPDIRNVGFRYVDIPDPTAGEGGGGTATGAVFFDKTTGKEIPQALGNNQFLVVDRATGQPKIQQGATDSFFGGLTGRVKDIAASPAGQMIISAVAPVLGQEIAAALNVSQAVGTAIASTAVQVASGVDPEKALQNAITNAVVSTGSNAVAKEINSALTNLDPKTAAAISNAAGSALSSAATTAAKGGSSSDIINSAVAGVAGSVTSSVTGDRVLGGAVTGGITGGIPGAAAGAASAAARPTQEPSFKQVSAYENLQDAIGSANLTPEEAQAVREAVQGVYAAASTAQALPATVSDVGTTAPTRLGAPFAANDPRFLSAMEKNPNLFKAFSEYTNTYGFSAGNTVYQGLLEKELAKTPEDKTLLEEYKRITGSEYDKPAEAAPPATDLGEIVITASKLSPEAAPAYTPEIITTPSVVVAVDTSTNKALVSDNSGKTTVVEIPPGTTVAPNQTVSVNPETNTIAPTAPAATTPSVTTPQPVVPAAETPAPAVTPSVTPSVEPSVTPSVTPEPSVTPSVTPSPSVIPTEVPPAVQPAPTAQPTPPVTPTEPSYTPSTLAQILGVEISPTIPPGAVTPTPPVTPTEPTPPVTPTEPVVPTVPSEITVPTQPTPAVEQPVAPTTPTPPVTPTEPVTNVVAAVNNEGTKALVYDNTGTPTIVEVQPGTTVAPGQTVSVDPATNTVISPDVQPGVLPEPSPAPAPSPATEPAPAPSVAPEVSPAVAPEPVPSPATAPVTEVLPEPAPQPRPVSPLTPATPPVEPVSPPFPSGPFVAPSFTADTGTTGTTTPTIPETTSTTTPATPSVTPSYVSETEPVSATPTPVDKVPEDKTKTKEETYRPSLTTATVSPARTSALSRVLQGQYYPVSTTGLTAYRPAGEIESEESGKQRRDVWNEASLRLKDALGL